MANSNTLKVRHNFLTLSFCGQDKSRSWVLSFQEVPELGVVLEGDIPTRNELIEALAAFGAPVYMIGVCQAAVATAMKARGKA